MKQLLQLRLVLLAATVLVLTTLLLSWFALRHFSQGLPPEMARTVTTVSYSVSHVMQKAQENGVPFEAMVGVGEFLDLVRKDNPMIVYMRVNDPAGRMLYSSGLDALAEAPDAHGPIGRSGTALVTEKSGSYFDTGVPLVFGHTRVGTLHLGQQATFVERQLKEVAYDIATTLVVASLIALELLRFVLTFAIATPADVMRAFLARVREGDFSHYLPHDHLGGIGQLSAHFNRVVGDVNRRCQQLLAAADAGGAELAGRVRARLAAFRFHPAGQRATLHASALAHIRWPFFLLIFADSMSLSFFPVFVGQFYSPAMGVSKSVVIGLPISIFMFTWALSMPWAGMWSDRVGHRKAFMVGAAVTTAGLILTAFAHSLYDLLLWRSLTAFGYGLVFITAQGYVAANTPPSQRTRGMAVFLSSFFAGSLSGSAIGGILSDRLGYEDTILLSGLLSAASALFVLRFLRANAEAADAPARKALTLAAFLLLLRNKKFVAITFLCAVPAKIALTGFLYYTVPLYLKLQGNNQSTTGRVMMAYGLAIIALSPFAAKLADRIGRLRWFVTIGGYASALSMLIIYHYDNTFGLLASITLLGIAHAIGVSPQLALINDFCRETVQEVGSGTATGIFRLVERLGNVLGPVVAAVLIARFGFRGAFLGIGIMSFCCVTTFAAMFFWFDRHPSGVAADAA